MTPHVSVSETQRSTGDDMGSYGCLFISIIPERDRSCYFRVHDEDEAKHLDQHDECRVPLGYDEERRELPELMTLQRFFEGGYEIADGKLLVCVKSVGKRKKGTWTLP